MTISNFSLASREGHLLKFCEVEVLKVLEQRLVLHDLFPVDLRDLFVDRAALVQVLDPGHVELVELSICD